MTPGRPILALGAQVKSSRRSVLTAAWLLGLILLLPGCVIRSSAPTASPSAATPGDVTPTVKPEKGGTLVVSMPLEPDVLNFTLSDSKGRFEIDPLF